jgi:hypothetical protein
MIVDDLLVEARDVFPHRPGPTEALAAQAAATLHGLGLINAADLDGGSAAWAVASLPIVASLGHASTPRTPRGQVAEQC